MRCAAACLHACLRLSRRETDQDNAPAPNPSAALSMPISLHMDQDLNPAHQAWLARVVSRGRRFYQRLSQVTFTIVQRSPAHGGHERPSSRRPGRHAPQGQLALDPTRLSDIGAELGGRIWEPACWRNACRAAPSPASWLLHASPAPPSASLEDSHRSSSRSFTLRTHVSAARRPVATRPGPVPANDPEDNPRRTSPDPQRHSSAQIAQPRC